MKRITQVLLALFLVLNISGVARAEYPDSPISMIIAFTAGGSSDVQARIMQKYWGKYCKQPLVFVYKPGAGGALGFTAIAMSKPDGYTIGGVNTPHIILQPLMQRAPFSIDKFDYICQVVNDPQVVAVRKDSKFKSVKEIFAYAKANPKKLRLGLVGPNSGHHLMYLELADKYDFPVTPVFYKGAADQNAALLGGEIDVMFGNLNDVMRSLSEMHVLGIASEKHDPTLPKVQTMHELGFNIVSYIRRGFVAPKGVDKNKLAYLRGVFQKIANDPAYIADMKKAGQPGEYLDGDAFSKWIHAEEQNDKAILKKAKLLK
jgi:tripartite-type tricarboxylate transporter receptor subunit TctC